MLLEDIVKYLINKNITIATMESCTGGLLASMITDIEGASNILKFSAITYASEYKVYMGVKKETINTYTVYSREVVQEMAYNIAKFAESNYGVGITGKLNRVDKHNLFGEDNKVFFSIYDIDNDVYYDNDIVVKKSSRRENKEEVINMIIDSLLVIVKDY